MVEKSGSWFSYGDERIGQGRENSKNFLTEHPEVMMEISDKVMIAAGLIPDPNAPADDAGDADDTFTDADDEPISLD